MSQLVIRVTTYVFDAIGARDWVFESDKIIDHANSSDRKWLSSHCFWALRNDRRVTTTPIRNKSLAPKLLAAARESIS